MCASPMASPSNRQPFLDPYKGHYSIHVSCSADGPSKAVISGRQSRHGYGNHHLHRVPVYSTTNNPSRLPVYPLALLSYPLSVPPCPILLTRSPIRPLLQPTQRLRNPLVCTRTHVPPIQSTIHPTVHTRSHLPNYHLSFGL